MIYMHKISPCISVVMCNAGGAGVRLPYGIHCGLPGHCARSCDSSGLPLPGRA